MEPKFLHQISRGTVVELAEGDLEGKIILILDNGGEMATGLDFSGHTDLYSVDTRVHVRVESNTVLFNALRGTHRA